YLGLPREEQGGVLITRTTYGGSAWDVLEPGDVLLEIDGVPVAADGTVPLRDSELIDFSAVPARRFVGDRITVNVWRKGAELRRDLILRPPQYFVAEDRYDVKPTFYIFGGLVFVPLTRDYLKTWDDPWCQNAPRDLMALYENGVR